MMPPNTNRRTFLKTTAAGGLGLILAARQAPAASEQRAPNLLFMHLDQWYWEAASAFGCTHVRTPAIDRLPRKAPPSASLTPQTRSAARPAPAGTPAAPPPRTAWS